MSIETGDNISGKNVTGNVPLDKDGAEENIRKADKVESALTADNSSDTHLTLYQKRRDSAALLPIFGVLLFMTPFVSTFTSGDETGVTGTGIYIFGIWAFLIICAFFLSRVLAKEITPEPEEY